MRHHRHWRVPAAVGVLTTTMALCVPAFAGPALAAGTADASSAAAPASSAAVSTKPASGTPSLAKTGSQQTISQIVQCGGTMYAVGRIWNVQQNGKTYYRDNAFSFSATAPYTMTSWAPQVTGSAHSIAFANGNCSEAYIGGTFSKVDGQSATNIAAVNASTGSLVTGFERYANAPVYTLLGYQGHVLAGGKFTRINGTARTDFASLRGDTGKVDAFMNLHLSGHVQGEPAQVYNQQLSHGGTLDLVEGNFTSAGGQPRQQIFMLNLAGATAHVTGWTSRLFTDSCIEKEAFYIRSAAWSPDDSTIYVADTGDHPLVWHNQFPLWGMCDAVAAFPATQQDVNREWVEYSGCDSYYSVAADSSTVYAAGHPRWADNPNGCNRQGSGGVPDLGLQGLNASNGKVLLNSQGKAMYSMSRANGDSMLLTSAGLWIASTNRYGSDVCDHYGGHAGICLLPSA